MGMAENLSSSNACKDSHILNCLPSLLGLMSVKYLEQTQKDIWGFMAYREVIKRHLSLLGQLVVPPLHEAYVLNGISGQM